ncbi:MAG: amidohydrolase family protein [Planctomycetes bacterium]|nr:amidohydrolase family protein [Planctomycetota bacterium]
MKTTSQADLFSRRRFCGHLFAAGAASVSLGTSWASAAQPAGSSRKANLIDVHVHLGQPWTDRGALTVEMLLRWMDAHEVAQACVLPLISPESYMYVITPAWVLEQTAPYRDRLIPFCSMDPRNPYMRGPGLRDQLRRYIDAGARGFGEHKWGGAVDDQRNIDMLGVVAEMKLPVLFHMDNIRNTDRPGLPGLDKLLTALPNVVMIGHGPGWWASISGDATQQDLGGYPRGPIAPGGAMEKLMAKHANLYADLSAGSGSRALQRDLKFAREFLIRLADRMMFGTDFLQPEQAVDQFAVLRELNLPDEVFRKIANGNARRVLGLS